MILCIGEILADMIGSKREQSMRFDCFAGGAPFNVACGIAKLGCRAAFFGCVGNDAVGRFLREYADGVKGLQSRISVSPDRNTTLAFVTLSEEGERSFSFYRRHTADYALELSAVRPLLADADIVHLGSLMLSEEAGRRFAEEVCSAVKESGKRLSFDVNYREDIFASAEEARRIYSAWLERADILKLSDDEADLFFGEERERSLLCLSEGRKVFVTLGRRGARLYENGAFTERPTVPAATVDTTGAGDAFYAGALSRIDAGENDAGRLLLYANVCGAIATERYGATAGLPSAEEVRERLNG